MNRALGNGVIGNTAVSGTVIQGSSPCSPTIARVFRLVNELHSPY